jgi:chemotaxis-related protein WspD
LPACRLEAGVAAGWKPALHGGAPRRRRPVSPDCWNDIGVWAPDGATCPLLEKVVHCHNCDVFARAGRGLLDQLAPPDYLEQWLAELARPKDADGGARLSLFVFRIGAEWLGLATSAVAQVAGALPVRTIPGRTSGMLAGLVNIHSELHLCFSMKALLGIVGEDERCERTIVIGNDDGHWVFPADEVWGILDVDPQRMNEAPVTIARDAGAHVRYIIDWERGKLSCLDEQLVFATLLRRATSPAGAPPAGAEG